VIDRARRVETVVIGAGQAGLTMSSLLREAGREHLVVDRRDRHGGGWLDRWESFRLVTPNWTAALNGYPYDGGDPDGFMPRDEIAARIARYATAIDAPVDLGTTVHRLAPRPDRGRGFRLTTSRGTVDTDRVVVATGGFHTPKIPAIGDQFPTRLLQLHSQGYRSEAALPSGAVLVIGTGQSGVQIAEELHHAGRRVILSVGRCGRAPRRYRGRDFFYWLWGMRVRGAEFGVALPTIEQLPDPLLRFACNPHLSGHDGGHETNLRRMARDGIRLVGRITGVEGERIACAPDLAANLAFADAFFDERLRGPMDTYIERSGADAGPDDREPFTYEPPAVGELDLAAEDVSTVIWTTGYALDFSWIDLPILDDAGVPFQDRGVSPVPGLTFIGLPWLRDQGSATLFGVARDAIDLAERMETRAARRPLKPIAADGS
jgi:putative flavoprotein involved in K+ transport